MKNSHLLIASMLPAICLAGCNSTISTETPETPLVRATIAVSGNALTKATDVTSSDESAIKNLQIFVFDETGAVEYYLDAGESSTGEIVTKEGKKTVTAVVNAPSLKDVSTRTSLMTMSTLLSDNGKGSMIMTGEVEAVLQDGGKINIPVTRIISKVLIKKITSNFASSYYASKTFTVNSIYLINVAGDNTFSASSEPTIWYNKLGNGNNDSACKAFDLLYDNVGTSLAYKSSYTKDHSFYCYPNLISTETFESVWSPRHTMLVVEAQLDGEKTYYPIELPVIGRNKCIILEELIITKKGSDYPYVPVMNGDCDVTVSVVDWDVILNYTETI